MPIDAEKLSGEVDAYVDQILAEKESAVGLKGFEAAEEQVVEETQEEQDVEDTGEEDVEVDEPTETVPEEQGEQDVKETTVTEKLPVTFDSSLLAKAVGLGISLSEARSFPDNDSLSEFVQQVEEVRSSRQEKSAEKAATEDPLSDLPDLDPAEFEPEVIDLFNKMKEVIRKQDEKINKLAEKSDEVGKGFSDAQVSEVTAWYDKAIDGLGEQYKEVLGAGSYESLDQRTVQFKNRVELANKMQVLAAGYASTGGQIPSRDRLLNEAVSILFRDVAVKAKEEQLRGDLKKRSKQHIARASGNKAVKSEDALAAVADLVNEKFF